VVLRLCRRVLRHEQDAEDAFQATFLMLVRKARSIGKRQAVASWLYKVAYRIALEAKTRATKRETADKQGNHFSIAEAAVSPSDVAGAQETRDFVEEAVAGLPEKYRTPIILCYFQGKTHLCPVLD